jgi:hypothetical protein
VKTIFVLFVAALLAAPPLLAKDLSVREKRLQEKTRFQIDKTVENTTTIDETILNDTGPEKILTAKSSQEKTIRADKIGRHPINTRSPAAKKRNRTHFREWP